ncbi:MAG: endonuclease III, partial [Chloroflexota bacterium]|nr:endonuclease III [Chloroflexota bacterium]
LIESKISAERAHERLGELVPTEDVYQLHMNMVEHGRRVCKAQRPKCTECVLGRICLSNQQWHF